MGEGRRWWSVATALVVAASLGLGHAPASAKPGDRLVICHRTSSPTNPYNQVVVANAGVLDGHAGHRGPVFSPGLAQWGDIIPPVRPGLPLGRNWAAGRDVWRNGCEVPPDVGARPRAAVGDLSCVAARPTAVVVLVNGREATRPATFTVQVDGQVVREVGPLAPGERSTVVLSGDLAALEDRTVTIEVVSDGEVLESRVVTVDCEGPVQPAFDLRAAATCSDGAATGVVVVRNDGANPIVVTATVDDSVVGVPVSVAPGATAEGAADLSTHEDETIVVDLLVDGRTVATYTVTPDCRPPVAEPRARARLLCSPTVAVVRLANVGDPDSSAVFTIRVDGRRVLTSAPVYGGESTTIVQDLRSYEGQVARVTIRSGGSVVRSRPVRVSCGEVRGGGTGSARVAGVPLSAVGQRSR